MDPDHHDLIYRHFSTVAPRYNDLRTTDSEPVELMARRLATHQSVAAADVGCGTGRYGVELLHLLGDRLHVHFIDWNPGMLAQLRVHLEGLPAAMFSISLSPAERLPLAGGSLDCMLTFNAVHHFRLADFSREVAWSLRPGGLLFIYTRLANQNERSVWGRYFPGFRDKERRLYDEQDLIQAINSTPALEVQDVTYFSFRRTASLEYLLERARNNHYSTFCLYGPQELERAAQDFGAHLAGSFGDLNAIEWTDENVMLTVERR